ncbi:unnamed protein product [Soboliphyme baturini]|uniref:Transposase n=1 Tax=Soboliphyme baturini TaxID=241478 RepID=A0A183J1Z1_9BILA|nr:unnamed protein product [Soboliphyme baturini]
MNDGQFATLADPQRPGTANTLQPKTCGSQITTTYGRSLKGLRRLAVVLPVTVGSLHPQNTRTPLSTEAETRRLRPSSGDERLRS